MKKLVSSLLFLLSFIDVFAGVIVIEGKYQNGNLYIQNGIIRNGVGFCTYEVRVNGNITADEVNSSTFEIDFPALSIKPGTAVAIEIRFKNGCAPKVLNPEVLKPQATFDVINIYIDKKGILNWSTNNEMGSLPYIIEQFRWNKWVPIGEVKGKGTMEKNFYSFQITPHSGENKFRVKQIGYGDVAKVSENVMFISTIPKPTYEIKSSKAIDFSSETSYEVYDIYGKIIKRGYGDKIDILNLENGNYYLCYDDIMTEFSKK